VINFCTWMCLPSSLTNGYRSVLLLALSAILVPNPGHVPFAPLVEDMMSTGLTNYVTAITNSCVVELTCEELQPR
jgi:hypothetical protein